MNRIAVIGPGAIGATVAAWLCQVPANRVTVCARSPIERLTIDAPSGTLTASPKIVLSPEAAEPVDWVLVATKAYDVAGAALWLPRLTGPHTRIAILQNGVEHRERFAGHADPARLVPVIVDIPAQRRGPGHIWQRRDGTLTVADDAGGRAFAALFPAGGPRTVLVNDLRSQAWRKLALNAAGAVSAVVLKPAGIAKRPEIAAIMRDLARECIAVGQAEGAVFEENLVETIVASYRDGPPDAMNSLHADRAAGRPIEIDARNGAIVRIGRRHGIATPMNATIVALLEAAAAEV